MKKDPIYTAAYLLAIIIANLTITIFGPSMVILNAFLFIGLDLTIRDRLHQSWRGERLILKMGLLIMSGSLLSWVLNADSGRIATASFVAFLVAATIDSVVYHLLGSRSKTVQVNGSNIAGAFVDSLLFPTIAFGSFLPMVIIGQFFAKVLGGLLWFKIIFWRRI